MPNKFRGLTSIAIAVGVTSLGAAVINRSRAAETQELPASAAQTSIQQSASKSTQSPARIFVKPSDDELKKKLTDIQYEVTQHEGTERPFQNEYWDNHEDGIYVDVVSGEPLFSSKDKFESRTGWPSFTRPLEPENVRTKSDRKLLFERNEIRSTLADSHLGHVFKDGPAPTGLRYCMNSAAMRFVPVNRLEAEGYGQYLALFGSGGEKKVN
ncbi:MAG: peptide-methionine (R)-S-oxide reductase MsrB [Gemmatimonadaceae bacterium]|nr:peptide-methionine (R)-S-oxide reductase MsrB [Gemmatimonadaceae bacterium]